MPGGMPEPGSSCQLSTVLLSTVSCDAVNYSDVNFAAVNCQLWCCQPGCCQLCCCQLSAVMLSTLLLSTVMLSTLLLSTAICAVVNCWSVNCIVSIFSCASVNCAAFNCQMWLTLKERSQHKIRKYLLFHNKNKFFYTTFISLKSFCSKVIYNLTNKQQFMLRTPNWGAGQTEMSLLGPNYCNILISRPRMYFRTFQRIQMRIWIFQSCLSDNSQLW